MNRKEHPIVNLLFNILLPVWILNSEDRVSQLELPLDPQTQYILLLLIAISLPVGYGFFDYFKNDHKKNPLSIIGAINVMLSGCFALLKLDGFWFAVKEGFFPFIIGVWFLYSVFKQAPLMRWVVEKSNLFQIQSIQSKLDDPKKIHLYNGILRNSTMSFAYCFFFSAFLNFILAIRIFARPNASLTSAEHQNLINQQIADMTWISFLVIGLPLTLVSGYVFWKLISRLKEITDLSLEQIINVDKK